MSDTNSDFNVSVTFRHTESTEALKSYATEKLTHCAAKYIHGNADINVVLWVEKRDHIVEVRLKSKDFDIASKAITEDLYSAIDKVVDVLEAQIRKQKGRIRDHKHHAARSAEELG